MLTLNQIKKKLIEYFKGHGQINQVVYSTEVDFAAENELEYPVAHITYVDSSFTEKLKTHRFIVKLADLTDESIEDHHDHVVSDMLEIAEDFYGWLAENGDFDHSKNASIKNDSEDHGDIISYISFPLNITMVRKQSDCDSPKK